MSESEIEIKKLQIFVDDSEDDGVKQIIIKPKKVRESVRENEENSESWKIFQKGQKIRSKRQKFRRSYVWQHCIWLQNGKNVQCKYCDKVYLNKNNVTSNLNNHLKTRHREQLPPEILTIKKEKKVADGEKKQLSGERQTHDRTEEVKIEVKEEEVEEQLHPQKQNNKKQIESNKVKQEQTIVQKAKIRSKKELNWSGEAYKKQRAKLKYSLENQLPKGTHQIRKLISITDVWKSPSTISQFLTRWLQIPKTITEMAMKMYYWGYQHSETHLYHQLRQHKVSILRKKYFTLLYTRQMYNSYMHHADCLYFSRSETANCPLSNNNVQAMVQVSACTSTGHLVIVGVMVIKSRKCSRYVAMLHAYLCKMGYPPITVLIDSDRYLNQCIRACREKYQYGFNVVKRDEFLIMKRVSFMGMLASDSVFEKTTIHRHNQGSLSQNLLQYFQREHEFREQSQNISPASLESLAAVCSKAQLNHPEIVELRHRMHERMFWKFIHLYVYSFHLQVSRPTAVTANTIDQSTNETSTLSYQVKEDHWRCECRLLEWIGLPCVHLIRVITFFHGSISHYINQRWFLPSPIPPNTKQQFRFCSKEYPEPEPLTYDKCIEILWK